MRRSLMAFLPLLAASIACHASPRAQTPTPAALAGDVQAEPSLAVLPEMLRVPPGMNERTHTAFTMASALFAAPCPVAPSDRSYAVLSAWVESAVTQWVERRRDGILETNSTFAHNTPQTASDAVVSSAVSGLLQEDTALALQNIPRPAELDSEPDIAVMFRDVVRAQARPFVGAALEAYRKCADAGEGGSDELGRWALFCRARFERLRNKDAQL
jgi:hypothetical protein